MENDNDEPEVKHREHVSMKEYYCSKMMIRLNEGTFYRHKQYQKTSSIYFKFFMNHFM